MDFGVLTAAFNSNSIKKIDNSRVDFMLYGYEVANELTMIGGGRQRLYQPAPSTIFSLLISFYRGKGPINPKNISMDNVTFLFDEQLIAEVSNLIRNARHRLLLISPFIDLDARIIDALNEKKKLLDFQLFVLFGKNQGNYKKSIRQDSLEYFKGFPNVEIRYNERLHAKFYQNDSDFIMTSLNLYDYSLAKNIEVGIQVRYSAKGLFWKAMDASIGLLDNGIDKVKESVLGMEKEIDPVEKFKIIFDTSDLKYKTEPTVVGKDGIKGFFGGKKLDGFNVVANILDGTNNDVSSNKSIISGASPLSSFAEVKQQKLQSATQLGKTIGISAKEFTLTMQRQGFISGDKITDLGLSKGLMLKNYMGNIYIAYPESIMNFIRR